MWAEEDVGALDVVVSESCAVEGAEGGEKGEFVGRGDLSAAFAVFHLKLDAVRD